MSTTLSASLTGAYRIDPTHSSVGFVARHAMVTKVRGHFNEFAGEGFLDAEIPSGSSLNLVVQAASIDTGNADRDNHLRGNDFFDMANFPEISFRSTSVQATGESAYRVSGDLTMKGVTRPVNIDFEYTGAATDPFGNQRIGFEGSTTVNRKDWGITWNAPLEAGGVLVSEKVTLEFDVSAIRVVEAA
jgi:polyisoprenoid-binding protein YceI